LINLAGASAAYEPISYNDAAALRMVQTAALDSEITATGDAGDEAAYGALKSLRTSTTDRSRPRQSPFWNIRGFVMGRRGLMLPSWA
jgi:hypothetical protein